MNRQREVAIAKRCQILCGQHESIVTSCPCEYPGACRLSADRRRELVRHPQVQQMAAKNFKLMAESEDA